MIRNTYQEPYNKAYKTLKISILLVYLIPIISISGFCQVRTICNLGDSLPSYVNVYCADMMNAVKKTKGSVKLWQTNVVDVCWENPSPTDANYRNSVQSAIINSWEKEIPVKFIGWNKCNSKSSGVRIKIADEQPGFRIGTKSAPLYGSHLDGQKDGLVLNFTFNKWGNDDLRNKLNGDKTLYIKSIAVHEFGHVLGLPHQNERKDCEFDCPEYDQMKQNTVPSIWVTPCDLYSVMNYCNPSYCNLGGLSSTDKATIKLLYGDAKTPNQEKFSIAYTINPDFKTKTQEFDPNNNSNAQMGPPQSRDVIKVELRYYQVDIFIISKYLDTIKEIKYDLRPFFENSVTYSNNKTSFGIEIYPWGQFKVKATLYFKDTNKLPLVLEKDLDGLSNAMVTIFRKNSPPSIIRVGGRGGGKFDPRLNGNNN